MQMPPSPLLSMMRGLCSAYGVVLIAYFPVASAGYAAFGNVVSPDVLLSVRRPEWLISLANFMVVVHLAASFQVHCLPAFSEVCCVDTPFQMRCLDCCLRKTWRSLPWLLACFPLTFMRRQVSTSPATLLWDLSCSRKPMASGGQG